MKRLGGLLFCAVAQIAVARAIEFAPGLQLTYRGEVARLSGDGNAGSADKRFDLWLLMATKSDAGAQVNWLLEESGRGQAPWVDRYGLWKLDGNLATTGPSVPTLSYDRDGQPNPIKLPPPLLHPPKALAADAHWSDGKLNFTVDGSERLEDRDCWRVRVANEYGRKRTLWIDKQTGLVAGIDERVFMGRGEEHQLRLRLVGSTQLSADELAKQSADLELLSQLRDKLELPADGDRSHLSAHARDLLSQYLPLVEQAAVSAPLIKIVQAARQDLASQADRADRLADLVARHEGKPVEKFDLHGIGSAALSDADLAGQVTVLHFWDYRDEPLREPYGQIGYLDFLYDKRKADGIRVYGVAVDGRLADPGQRAAAIRAVTRLQGFMNISYPILLDDGRVLKQFGDPRTLGGQLPLFVVIGPDANIAHYFVGCYEVDRDAGLKRLDQILTDTLKRRTP